MGDTGYEPLSEDEEARVRAGLVLGAAWPASDDYQHPDGDYGKWVQKRVWATLDAVRERSRRGFVFDCSVCRERLAEPGGILVGAVRADALRTKKHVCVRCWSGVDHAAWWITIAPPSGDGVVVHCDRLEELEARYTVTALEVPQPIREEDPDPETIVRTHLDGRPPRKYIPVDGAELREIVGAAVASATVELTCASWDDQPLPEDAAMDAAFPTRSGMHAAYAAYAEAMRLVGACQSKGRLVKLVNWLLVRLATERAGT